MAESGVEEEPISVEKVPEWTRDLSSLREMRKGDYLCDLGTLVVGKRCEKGDGLGDLGT